MAKSPAQTANSRLYSKYTHVYMYTDHTVDFQQSNVCITTIHVPNIFDDDIVQNYRAPQHLVPLITEPFNYTYFFILDTSNTMTTNTAAERTQFMRQLLTDDGNGDADAGQYAVGEGSANRQTVDEVVHAVAKHDHPGDAFDDARRGGGVCVSLAVAIVGEVVSRGHKHRAVQ